MKKSLLVLAVVAALDCAAATAGEFVRAQAGRGIPDCYVVVLKPDAVVRAGALKAGVTVSQLAVGAAARFGGRIEHFYETALTGYSICLPEKAAQLLADDPSVELVEQDQVLSTVATQSGATWGIDRIDQRNLPLSGTYTYNFNGAGVHAYIIDTGIRATHQQFGGRVSGGFTAINDGNGTNDCNGHGTHVSGTVGSATYGVAKGVSLHPVRVLDCTGSGSTSGVIAGVNWVTQNRVLPAVANMSLGGGVSSALDTAVANSIASGVTYAIAAGNSNANACNSSPARVATALTVGSTTTTDARSSFSNFGTCVDVFAPGSSITSTWNTSDTATNTISGTSMATPHVAGVAALYLSQFGNQSAAAVAAGIVGNATTGVVGNPGTGSPNRLLFSLFGGGGGGTTVFSDGFETATGWTTNPSGTDTATTGAWQRGAPQQTASGSVMQLGACAGGANCLVTGLTAGASVGDNDVDSGTTSIQSPPINLPATGTLTLGFSYYFAHLNNSSSADFFRVSIVGAGGTTQVFQELGSAANDAAAYSTQSVNISSFAGQSIRILIQAADAATGSLVEAAVDNVTVTQQ
ncbi:MAG TPA: S8 family peptidase [Vicinamibacteria bacterium]|nr:S8 family peptidase [Vicinamibacteria bacterium]